MGKGDIQICIAVTLFVTIQAYRIQESEYRMKTATTRVAATSFSRIAVAAGLVPAITIPMPE